MEEQEIILVKQIKNLYETYQFKECISQVEEFDINRSFICHQQLQLYKGVSLFENQQYKDGISSFEQIIQESTQLKQKIEGIDVIIRTLYLYSLHFYAISLAEENNKLLGDLCEEYKQQNENQVDYQKGIYLFGKGMYLYIESFRELINKKSALYLEESLKCIQEYNYFVLIALGKIYFQLNQYKQANKYYQQLYEQNNKFPGVTNNYALCLTQINEYCHAEKLFLEAEQLYPTQTIILKNIAVFYGIINKPEKEKEYIDKIYALNNEGSNNCYQKGLYLFKMGKIEEGLMFMEKGKKLDPDNLKIYFELGMMFYNQDKLQKSIDNFKECIRLLPNEGSFYYFYGLLLLELGETQKAKKNFQKVLEIKCDQIYKMYTIKYLGKESYSHNKFNEALDYLLKGFSFQIIDEEEEEFFQILIKIINSIPQDYIEETILKETRYVVVKFEKLSQQIKDLKIKYLLLTKHTIFREILTNIVYIKTIEPWISYQSPILFWDLYFD